jgi:hypothetical protein
MFDGLWTGEWRSNINNLQFGTGVVIFRQGKVFGGNDRFYFVGTYHSTGNCFDGNLNVTYHAGEPLGIFGLADINQSEDMAITGQLTGDEIKLEGTLQSNRKLKLQGRLQKQAGPELF